MINNDEKIMSNLIDEVNNYGFNIKDYNELKAIKRKIKSIIPMLFKYLYLFNGVNYTDSIIRLLSVKGFNDATEELISIYNKKIPNIDNWVIGDALYSIQDKRFEDEYIKIISDKENGDSRQMLVILLGKLKCDKAVPILIDLLEDEDVNGHAIMALGYFKNIELIQYIEPFLNHEKRWIRKEAEKSINKINKNISKV